MPYAAALSQHPLPATATGEVAGAVLEALGPRPDLVVVTVTPAHAGVLADIAGALDGILHPLVLLGCASDAVLTTGREIEDGPAVSLWAARCGLVAPVRLRTGDTAAGAVIEGWPAATAFPPAALIVLADPFTFSPGALFEAAAAAGSPPAIVGGNASAARGPGATRLVLGAASYAEGAVGAVVGGGVTVTPVLSQGTTPYGPVLTVTSAEGHLVRGIAGKPALRCIVDLVKEHLPPDRVAALDEGGLHLGVVVRERGAAPHREDVLVRSVVGADRDSGAVAFDGAVPLGSTVQLHLRDADSARVDLRAALRGAAADGVLAFPCNGRGTRLFDVPHHDAGLLSRVLGPVPAGGCAVAGEFGPVSGENFVHGFSLSMALFSDPPA